jgi:peptide/nickel transport system permease protein
MVSPSELLNVMSETPAVSRIDDYEVEKSNFLTMVFEKIRNITSNRVLIYTFRRIMTMIPLFIGISIITYTLMYLAGDPLGYLVQGNPHITEQDIQNIAESLGLNRPPMQQYLMWLWDFVRLDLGITFFSRQPTLEVIGTFLSQTLKLQITQFLISLIISILLGILAAKFQNTWVDSGVSALALLGMSMPIFVYGNLLIFIFAGRGLSWFPPAHAFSTPEPTIYWSELWNGGFGKFLGSFFVHLGDSVWHLVLPVSTLVFASLALFTRLIRSSMLEVLRQDYILAARANGLSERVVLIGHGLRNALLPVVTYIGIWVGTVLAGTPITETVFSYPGLGNRFVQAVNRLDHPLIMGISMVITLMILIANLLTDISYVWIDPRIEI